MGRAEEIFETIKRDGIAAIEDFILQRKSEDLFLDFKKSSDSGSGNKLHDDDRKNLAKMISAFGNSNGGVIVWGVDCSYDPKDASDLPRAKYPIDNPHRFVSRLEGVVSGCTIPAHPGVIHHSIISPDSQAGFVVTLIPESSLAPHQDRFASCYYIRVGSNCERAPHAVLAGMFGRRPTPNISLMFIRKPPTFSQSSAGPKVTMELGFLLAHKTPVIARDIYFSTQYSRRPGGNCKLGWTPPVDDTWKGQVFLNQRYSAYTVDQFKLPQETPIVPVTLNITLCPPFTHPLGFECW